MSGITSFVTLATTSSDTSTAYLMPKSGLSNWAYDNRALITVAGNTYTAKTSANFSNIVGSNNPASNGIWNLNNTRYYPSASPIAPGKILRDLGQDAYIGVPGQANMLHLRLVQPPGSVPSGGLGMPSGYVVVETNADIFNGANYPNTSVARA